MRELKWPLGATSYILETLGFPTKHGSLKIDPTTVGG